MDQIPMKLRLALIALVTLAFVACSGTRDAAPVFYKPTGTLQCAPSKTTQAGLEAELSALQGAGATVIASNCAKDGEAYITLCGAQNGDLFSVTVSPSSAPLALQLGYKPASQYSSARPIACQ